MIFYNFIGLFSITILESLKMNISGTLELCKIKEDWNRRSHQTCILGTPEELSRIIDFKKVIDFLYAPKLQKYLFLNSPK